MSGKGQRQAAIDGHIEIGRRCRELGVDTIVVQYSNKFFSSAPAPCIFSAMATAGAAARTILLDAVMAGIKAAHQAHGAQNA
jgi:hypothetical protein